MAIAPRPALDLLRDVQVLQTLPASDLDALSRLAEVRTVQKGDGLFAEGTPGEGLFVVRTGEVKVTKSGKDGREQILYLARPSRPIVEGLRFDEGTYPASAIAMRATSALLFPNAELARLGERAPRVMRALVDLRARRADRNLTLVSDLSLRTVPARLASFLRTVVAQRQERGEDARHLVRELTTETIAGRLGTVREEISRALALLEREGALNVSPDVVEILDLGRLEEIAFGSKKQERSAASKTPPDGS